MPPWTEDSFAGLLPNLIAGRVANRFDLGGENFTVDAACALSLAAVQAACRALADGSSDMVIAGGCDVVQGPFAYLCFAKTGALTPGGKPRVFDAAADGIVISEGVAALVLKRLSDAEHDGDRIYAVLKAIAGSSDGRSLGVTAPNTAGQMRAYRRVYRLAGFSPATVGLFEAHGTGTAVGDAAELESLNRLLQEADARPRSSAVGSVKSMIGHTKSSAGIVGVLKTVLALYHRVLPPTLNVEKPSPAGNLQTGPLYLNSELRPWIRGPQPRRAAVSAFGFGGTNFHAALEEYDRQAHPRFPAVHRRWPAELFLFRGKSRRDLVAQVTGLKMQVAEALAPGCRSIWPIWPLPTIAAIRLCACSPAAIYNRPL